MGDASSPPSSARTEIPEHSFHKILPIRILTHNIRFATDNPNDTEKLWADRFPYLSSHFKYHTRPYFAPTATLVCMQEVLHEQLLDLHDHTFNTSTSHSTIGHTDTDNDWTYVGVGRNDGEMKGEYSPIFFRKSAFKCVKSETIWLNENEEKGKKGWDADSIRILTYAVLESAFSSDATEGNRPVILAMNTHLDNDGEISRRESAKLILKHASSLRIEYSPFLTFLSGDLNSEPSGDAYKVLNAPGSGFIDTRRLLEHDIHNSTGKVYAFGNELTFTDFPAAAGAKGLQRIDFVHLGTEDAGHPGNGSENVAYAENKLQSMVQAYGVLPNRFDDRVWLSDHRAVVVDLLVPVL